MRSNIRNLTIVGVCVVVLGGALAALKLTGNDTGSASSSSSGASIQLVSKKSEDVVSMKVTNQKGTYTLLPMKTASANLKNTSSAPSDAAINYTVSELGGCPVDTSATSTVVQDGFSLVASKNLGTVSNLDQYGLKNPQASVDVSFKDGSTFSYKIGKPSATDASSYYMCGANSSNVYIVAADQGLFEEARYFASKTVTSIGGAGGQQQQNDFTKLTFTGAAYPQPVTIEDVNKVMMITSPERCETDYSALTAAQGQLTSLTANGVAAVNPDAAALKKYGFDKPTASVEFTVNKGSYQLTVGAKSSTGYYVMLGGVNVVYDVSADSVSGWVSAGLFGLRSKNVISPTIDDISGMTITSGSDVCKVDVARTKDTSKSTQDKTYYNYKVTQNNGKAVNYNKAYINFFENIAGIAILEDAKTVPSGTPALTIEYSYFEKPKKDVVQYIKSGDRRYTAVLNGKPFGIVTQDDLDTINSNVKQLEAGGEVH